MVDPWLADNPFPRVILFSLKTEKMFFNLKLDELRPVCSIINYDHTFIFSECCCCRSACGTLSGLDLRVVSVNKVTSSWWFAWTHLTCELITQKSREKAVVLSNNKLLKILRSEEIVVTLGMALPLACLALGVKILCTTSTPKGPSLPSIRTYLPQNICVSTYVVVVIVEVVKTARTLKMQMKFNNIIQTIYSFNTNHISSINVLVEWWLITCQL